jgi:hypothetical protein
MISINNKFLSKILLHKLKPIKELYIANGTELEKIVTLYGSVMICRFNAIRPLLILYGIENALLDGVPLPIPNTQNRISTIEYTIDETKSLGSIEKWEAKLEYKSIASEYATLINKDDASREDMWVICPVLIRSGKVDLLTKNPMDDVLVRIWENVSPNKILFRIVRVYNKEIVCRVGTLRADSNKRWENSIEHRVKGHDSSRIYGWYQENGIEVSYKVDWSHYSSRVPYTIRDNMNSIYGTSGDSNSIQEVLKCEDVSFVINNMDGTFDQVSACDSCPHGLKRVGSIGCTFLSQRCRDVKLTVKKSKASWSTILKKINKIKQI